MTMSSRLHTTTAIGFATLAGLLLTAQPAAAQAQTEKLQVQAFIGELCSVTSASLDFGQDVSVSTNTDAQGSIDVHCATPTLLNVRLDGGLTYNAGAHFRQMTGSGNPLLYGLYKDAGRTTLWDADDQVQANIEGDGSVPVYGRIPEQSDGHGPGLHTDEVTITLVF